MRSCKPNPSRGVRLAVAPWVLAFIDLYRIDIYDGFIGRKRTLLLGPES